VQQHIYQCIELNVVGENKEEGIAKSIISSGNQTEGGQLLSSSSHPKHTEGAFSCKRLRCPGSCWA